VGDEWRLSGQERYLQGATMHRRPYFLWRPDWDHDHCSFCWASFELPGRPLEPNEFDEGWTTDDEYHWVCPACFSDFQERFEWSVRQRLPGDHPDTPWPQVTAQQKGIVKK